MTIRQEVAIFLSCIVILVSIYVQPAPDITPLQYRIKETIIEYKEELELWKLGVELRIANFQETILTLFREDGDTRYDNTIGELLRDTKEEAIEYIPTELTAKEFESIEKYKAAIINRIKEMGYKPTLLPHYIRALHDGSLVGEELVQLVTAYEEILQIEKEK